MSQQIHLRAIDSTAVGNCNAEAKESLRSPDDINKRLEIDHEYY